MYLHRLIQQASLKTAATETIVPQSHARKNLARAALRAVGIFAWSWTLLSLCAYLFLCPAINTPLLDRLATWPCKEESWVAGHDFVGVRCLQLTFPVKAGAKTYKLSGAFYKHPGARDVILISHGNGGSLKYVHRMPQIAYLLSDAHSVFVYDYEGYGISEGNASYRSLARDGLAAFDYANKILGYGQKQILLYGLSMGTGVSCEIARVRSPGAIILDSPYTSCEDAARSLYPFLCAYPSALFPEPRYDNLGYLKGKHPPVLVFTPLNDYTIPLEQGYRIAREASDSVTFVAMPNSLHTCIGTGDERLYDTALKNFIRQAESDWTEGGGN